MSCANIKFIVLMVGVVVLLGCGPRPNENGYASGPALRVEQAKVEGLGVVAVGDVVLHNKFGKGRIVSLEAGLATVAEIDFAGETKFLVLDDAPLALQTE